VASWCDHPASQAICKYGVPAARVYCAYCGSGGPPDEPDPSELHFHPARGSQILTSISEDPDQRPYIWDIPEGDCKCH